MMATGTYKLADVVVQINSLYEEVQTMCYSYRTYEEPQLFISITEKDIISESKKSDEERYREGLSKYHYPAPYLETLSVYRKLATQLLSHNVLLIHGSVIAIDGEAYMFTALSGTGKSTHVRLWRQLFGERAVMINDDKPLIKVRCEEFGVRSTLVYGTPWDGKHHLSNNISVPLKAIVHLQRGEENFIEKLTPEEMLPILLQQTYRPNTALGTIKVMQLLDAMSHQVKFYSLHCNMKTEAARIAYEGMC